MGVSKINVEKYRKMLEFFEDGTMFYERGRVWKTKRVNSWSKLVELEEPVVASKPTERGYRRVHFDRTTVYEHTLIYALFNGIDSLKSIECIDHINGIKDDNVPSNLEGVTIKENNDRAKANGLLKPLKGELNGCCKLSDTEISLIRLLYKYGANQYEIAEAANVTQSHVSNIVNNKLRVSEEAE